MRLTWGMATWAAFVVLLAAPILAQPAFLDSTPEDKSMLAAKPAPAPAAPTPPRFLASATADTPAQEIKLPLLPTPAKPNVAEAIDERES